MVQPIQRVLLPYRMKARPTGRLKPTIGDRDDHNKRTYQWHIPRAKPPCYEPSRTAKELHNAVCDFVDGVERSRRRSGPEPPYRQEDGGREGARPDHGPCTSRGKK